MQEFITLIPIKEDLNKLKYWRPSSFLCIDNKMLTRLLSNRLKIVLPKIISEEQTCSIPNWTIFSNLFLIRDIITLAKENNKNLCIVQVDQEKEFDKIDHDFLYKKMNTIGFSTTFVEFIKSLYKNNISYVINNGYM